MRCIAQDEPPNRSHGLGFIFGPPPGGSAKGAGGRPGIPDGTRYSLFHIRRAHAPPPTGRAAINMGTRLLTLRPVRKQRRAFASEPYPPHRSSGPTVGTRIQLSLGFKPRHRANAKSAWRGLPLTRGLSRRAPLGGPLPYLGLRRSPLAAKPPRRKPGDSRESRYSPTASFGCEGGCLRNQTVSAPCGGPAHAGPPPNHAKTVHQSNDCIPICEISRSLAILGISSSIKK